MKWSILNLRVDQKLSFVFLFKKMIEKGKAKGTSVSLKAIYLENTQD